MSHQEHTTKGGNSSAGGSGGSSGGHGGGGGGKLPKKLKHNKVPQRGMGVAQLERIISEERQMKDVAVLTPNSTNFRSPAIPLPPPLPPNHHLSKSDAMNPNFVSKPMSANSGSGYNWRRFHYLAGENPNSNPDLNSNPNQNHRGYLMAMPINLNGLPSESNPPIWPSVPTITQRSHFQQPCSSSMVNVSLGTTSSTSASSAVKNFQIEPPSNQSYFSNKNTTFRQEEDKMVGMKRSYHFSEENMPSPSFNCKFPPYFSPLPRSDESALCSNGGTSSLELQIPVSRAKPSSLGSTRDQKTKKLSDENLGLTKDFLSLGPSRSPPRSHSCSKEKFPPLSVGELTQPPYQGDQTREPFGAECSYPKSLRSFFPAARTHENNTGEAGEDVDLNLKL